MEYVILALYVLMLVGIAFYSRKKSSSLKEFFLAGKGLGGWLSAFAYGTTYFSAVVFIGYAGKFGDAYGLAAVWIGIGNALIGTLLAWKVLAKRTKNMTTNLQVKTMPEFFATRYQCNGLKIFAAIIIFVFLIPYSASIYQGLAYLFEAVFKIDFIWCILIMAGLTALYLFFGGYFATALSDFFQGLIMLVGVFIMVFFILASDNVNFDLSAITEAGKGFIPQAGDGLLTSPLFNVIILTLLTSFGIWGLPQSIHKFYAIKNDKAIKEGMIISTIFSAIIGCSAYFIGALTNLFPTAANAEQAVPDMLLKVLPAGLLGLIVVLVLSASMSTLSSVSLASSSAVSVDIYKGFINKNASEKNVNLIMRVLCLVFVVVSAVLALLKIEAIVTLMGLSWGTLAGCFIGPYVYGITTKKATKASCWASLISGLVVTFAGLFIFGAIGGGQGFGGLISVGIKNSPLIGVIAMAVSMIIVPIVSAFTQKPSQELLDKAFSKPEIETEQLTEQGETK